MVQNAYLLQEISNLILILRIRNVLELSKVLRQNEVVVKDEPQLMLRVGFFHSENRIIILILLRVHRLSFEEVAVGHFGVEKAVLIIRNALDHQYLTDQNDTGCQAL
jgi:hypothetical protein